MILFLIHFTFCSLVVKLCLSILFLISHRNCPDESWSSYSPVHLMEPFASVAGVGSVRRSGGCTWGAGDMAGVFDRYGWSENVIDVSVDGALDSCYIPEILN